MFSGKLVCVALIVAPVHHWEQARSGLQSSSPPPLAHSTNLARKDQGKEHEPPSNNNQQTPQRATLQYGTRHEDSPPMACCSVTSVTVVSCALHLLSTDFPVFPLSPWTETPVDLNKGCTVVCRLLHGTGIQASVYQRPTNEHRRF